jgi:N-acetyl-anhydromuramyl-L-alanine amidase AmpD
MRPGLLFTEAQHRALVALGRDLAARHGWPAGWGRTPRLVGHEDVQLLERQDAGGGWDPGALRAKPYIDFEFIRARVG